MDDNDFFCSFSCSVRGPWDGKAPLIVIIDLGSSSELYCLWWIFNRGGGAAWFLGTTNMLIANCLVSILLSYLHYTYLHLSISDVNADICIGLWVWPCSLPVVGIKLSAQIDLVLFYLYNCFVVGACHCLQSTIPSSLINPTTELHRLERSSFKFILLCWFVLFSL